MILQYKYLWLDIKHCLGGDGLAKGAGHVAHVLSDNGGDGRTFVLLIFGVVAAYNMASR